MYTAWTNGLTVLTIALCLNQGSGSDVEFVDHKNGCILSKTLQEQLSCDVDFSLGVDEIIPEHTKCRDGENCLICQGRSLVEVDCTNLHERQKRGFFKKAFRSISRPFRSRGIIGSIFRRRRPVVVPNRPPTVTCPSIPGEITAPQRKVTAVVSWGGPVAKDDRNKITSVRQVSGKASGSEFAEGQHTIMYKVVDDGGLSATCSRVFKVRVIRCQQPGIDNGVVQCPGNVYGNTCQVKCNEGFETVGATSTTCQNNGIFTAPGTCKKIKCDTLGLPVHSKAITCTDGANYQSTCLPTCATGYVPARGARALCAHTRKWTVNDWKCEDTVKPVFQNCPTKKINTVDKKYRWGEIKATDNSGQVKVTQVQGQPSGSVLEYGVHIVKYVANDTAGNTENCIFTVELKRSDCPKPSSTDSDMKFTCNGLTAQSVCHLSCRSGSYVEGSKYISCVQDDTANNTSNWEPIGGTESRCYKKRCPSLQPPKNGALACDKQMGGTVCQIQCDDRFDVASGEGFNVIFTCGENTRNWMPANDVPDCLELAFPDEYSLPSEFFYFLGDCSDSQALREIKQQFLDTLKNAGISPCFTSDQCSVNDVEVTCGKAAEADGFLFSRRKRSVPNDQKVVKIRMTFHLKNSNRTLSPEQAKALLISIAEKSKNVMKTNPVMRRVASGVIKVASHARSGFRSNARAFSRSGTSGISRPAPTQVAPPPVRARSVVGELTMECARGQVRANGTKCVRCSAGTYYSAASKSCRPCGVGSYQAVPGSMSCHKCPPRHTTISTGAISQNACIELCGQDTFSPTGRVPCFPCPSGNYQPSNGAKTCLPCPGSKGRGQVSPSCANVITASQNVTNIRPEVQISEYLLTCDKEVCLLF